MKWGIFILPALLFSLISCNSPNEPVIINTQIDTTQLDSLEFQQISYDTVLIKDGKTIYLGPKYVKGVLAGSYINDNFTLLDTIKPVFESIANGYHLHINYKMSFPDTQLVTKIGVKFILGDGSEHLVNKTVKLYQYPYSSTKLLLTWNDFILPSIYYPNIQDFAFLPPKIYYHPYGPYGLYEYDMDTKETRLLYDYSSGDMLGANSRYIFFDHAGNKSLVSRYNLGVDSVDREYDIGSDISGIACSDSLVFVYVYNSSKLLTFSTELKLINAVDINYYVYSMGYYNGFLYAGDLENNISKIDPATGALVTLKIAPDRDVEGIFIYGGYLYYSDYTKEYIGYTPIKNIFPN